MGIIKLTFTDGTKEGTFPGYLNPDCIAQMYRGTEEDYTEIVLTILNPPLNEIWVTETPEQILNLIHGLELSKQKA